MKDSAAILHALKGNYPFVAKVTLIWGSLLSLCAAATALFAVGVQAWSLWSTRQNPFGAFWLIYSLPITLVLALAAGIGFKLLGSIAERKVAGAAWLILVGIVELILIQNMTSVASTLLGSSWGDVFYLVAVVLPALCVVGFKSK